MRRPTPRERRKVLDATEVAEFVPSTHSEMLRDQLDIGTYRAAGWIAPTSLSEDGWRKTGAALAGVERATPWWWGDWWNARNVGRVLPEGWTGPSLSTLGSYATVAKAFPLSRRRETVPFGHHAELTSLSEEEQDSLLNWCDAAHRPSVAALRAERKRREIAKLPSPPPPKQPPPPPKQPPPPMQPPPPTSTPQRIELPSALPLKVELSAPVSLPPPKALPDAPPATGDISVPVTVFVPEELHAFALEDAASKGLSLSDWIVMQIALAKQR